MSDERRPLLMRVLEAMQEADNYYVSADQAQVAIALARAEAVARIEQLEAALRLAKDALADIGVDDVLIAIDAALGEDRT